MQQTEKRHVTGQLNNMQIEWRQWIALRGVARPAESATGSLRASTREYETIWPAASNSKPSDPLMDRSSARVLAVRSELNEQTFFFFLLHTLTLRALRFLAKRRDTLFRQLLIPLDTPLTLNKNRKLFPVHASLLT